MPDVRGVCETRLGTTRTLAAQDGRVAMRFARSLDLRLIGGRCLAAAVIARLAGGAAHAQYRIDAWTSEQGLPQNSVNSIVQTDDGYLWLGTLSGIVRFDGVRFTLVDEGTPGALLSNRIMALHA